MLTWNIPFLLKILWDLQHLLRVLNQWECLNNNKSQPLAIVGEIWFWLLGKPWLKGFVMKKKAWNTLFNSLMKSLGGDGPCPPSIGRWPWDPSWQMPSLGDGHALFRTSPDGLPVLLGCEGCQRRPTHRSAQLPSSLPSAAAPPGPPPALTRLTSHCVLSAPYPVKTCLATASRKKCQWQNQGENHNQDRIGDLTGIF